MEADELTWKLTSRPMPLFWSVPDADITYKLIHLLSQGEHQAGVGHLVLTKLFTWCLITWAIGARPSPAHAARVIEVRGSRLQPRRASEAFPLLLVFVSLH